MENTNENLAKTFAQQVGNVEERIQLLKDHPELKKAVAIYEKLETGLGADGNLGSMDQRALQAVKELTAMNIKNGGPESVDAAAYNEKMAMTFKQRIENPAERAEMLKSNPELKNAVDQYQSTEALFNKDGSLSEQDSKILHGIAGNMASQIQNKGPASFGEVTHASIQVNAPGQELTH